MRERRRLGHRGRLWPLEGMEFADATVAELLGYGALLLLAGAVSGVLAGLFGIGGGAIIVPVLYEAFGALGVDETVRTHLAVGTSIAVIVPTSIRSYLAHRSRGSADAGVLRVWRIAVPAGVVVAILLAASISGDALRGIFAIIAVAFAIRFIAAPRIRPVASDLPDEPARSLVGAGIGFVSTLMGIGGGTLNNAFMTLFGRPMLQAVATSAGVGVLISIPALAGYIVAGWQHPDLPAASVGYVSLAAWAFLVPATVFAAPVGVRIAHRIDARALEIGFGIFLILVAARFAASLA